ncbi:sulfotransferase [Bacteroidota bacterium]
MNPLKKSITSYITARGKKVEQKHFSKSPIYIGGCGRSGTTLLLSILSAHKDIFACPRELNLFFDAEINGDQVHLPKIYRLYRTLLTEKIKSSAKRYCEKSPANVQRIKAIDSYHKGNFKLIHIIRDGRDVVLSKHPTKKDEYWTEPSRWVRDVSLGLADKDHPSVYTMHYEDLINEFEQTISGICNFLDIPVSEEILNWHKHTTVRKNRALYSPIKEISNSSIGKYTRPENRERFQLFMENKEAVELLKVLGYGLMPDER